MSILTTATNIALRVIQGNIQSKNFAIYLNDKNSNREVLQNLEYIDGSVKDDVQLMEHPLETGATIVDHEIFNPNEITIRALIDDNDKQSLNDLMEYYKKATPLSVRAKGELFTNLIISSKPYKIDSSYFNKSTYDISFREVQYAVTTYVKMKVSQVKKKSNASTSKGGYKQAQKVTPKAKPSVLRSTWNKMTGK